MKISPPNRDHYLSRCAALRRYLKRADRMPTIMVVYACWSVLKEALGSDLRALRWIVYTTIYSRCGDFKYKLWYGWHKYIRLRTEQEVDELFFKGTEELTGVDLSEWPDVVVTEKDELWR